MFRNLTTYSIALIFIGLAAPLPLAAAELKLIPALTVKEEYNDNIFLATGTRQRDFITTLTPSLQFSSAAEISNVNLSTGFNWLSYARSSSLNSVDAFVQGGGGYRISPRSSLTATAGYVRNSRPDRTDANTGLSLKTGSDQQNFQLTGNYAVSEKSTSSLSYAYSHEAFDSSALVTTAVHTATLTQDYDLGRYLQQAKLLGTFGFSRDLTSFTQVDNYTLGVGLTKKFHELWGFTINAGGRFTHSEFDVNSLTPAGIVTSKGSSDSSGWIGTFSFNYNDEYTTGALSFNRDITTASGRTGATQRTGVWASLGERFTRELSGFLGLGYSKNTSDPNQFSGQAIDEDNFTVNCGVRYDFSELLSLEGGYRYNAVYFNLSSSEARQNVFMLRLTMRRDLLDM